MNFFNKMERKYGRYALRNLPEIMIGCYVIGYFLQLLFPQFLVYLTLDPAYIVRGQVWRLLTWVLIPPSSFDLFTIITLFFYFSIAKALERTWGAFKFNVYIFSGILFTAVGAFILYGFLGDYISLFASLFSTYYINMSIFLAFALTYPNMEVLLYFLFPVKMKWMGLIYGVFILVEFVRGSWVIRTSIFMSLLNFVLFFLFTRKYWRFSPREIHRKQEFKKTVTKMQPKTAARHRCAVCGRTEKDGDHLEFRYCSKCDGNYEYCQDHLFSHQHIKKS